MKIYILLFYVLIVNTVVFAQKELHIEYKVKNGTKRSLTRIEAHLRANNSSVIFTERTLAKEYESGYWPSLICNQVFKDLGSNMMWSLEDRKTLVEESMDCFSWAFEEQSDTILNYYCKKSVATFRGREYIAWYTMDLPFRAAPWKINGLPGVVLKVTTSDGFYVLEAVNLQIKESEGEIDNPFNNKKSVTWEEYEVIYKQEIEEKEENMKALGIKYGREYNFSYPKIEILMEKNRITIDELGKQLGMD